MKNWPGVVCLGVVTGLAASAVAQDSRQKQAFRAELVGYNEVPAVSSPARGEFRAHLSSDGTSLSYELSFSDLIANVSQAHIHFGQHHTNGGIIVWLCQGSAAPPAGQNPPVCGGPRTSTVTGVITSDNVIGPGTQGISAGEFAELLAAMRAGAAYANVHSAAAAPALSFAGGEIRGQIN